MELESIAVKELRAELGKQYFKLQYPHPAQSN